MPHQIASAGLPAVARVSDHPFRHATFPAEAIVPGAMLTRLIETFPSGEELATSRREHGGDKTYSMKTLTLYHCGTRSPAWELIGPCWQEFVSYLTGPRYRREIAEVLGTRPGPVDLEIRLTEYARGGWLSRHTDRPDKVFSHNIYLCPGWLPEWGGGLALYESRLAQRPAMIFTPGAGSSLAFARSDWSWHEVLPVADHAAAPRRALLVHGYRASEHPQMSASSVAVHPSPRKVKR